MGRLTAIFSAVAIVGFAAPGLGAELSLWTGQFL